MSQPAMSPLHAAPPEDPRPRPRVCVIEDSRDLREMIHQFLTIQGFDVVGTAIDGVKGLALYRELRPDVLVTDLRMPHMDGLELAQSIRQTDAITGIVVFTAYDHDESLVRALEVIPRTTLVPKNRLSDLGPAIKALVGGDR
jgi:DNA-binding response OmpR family regulator